MQTSQRNTKQNLSLKDQQLLDHLSNKNTNQKNRVIHLTTRGPVRAQVVWHELEKSFSVLMFLPTSVNGKPLLLDPLRLGAGHSIKANFKFVLIQIECLMRENLGSENYDCTYSTAKDYNLPKEFIGYEVMTLSVNFSTDSLINRLSSIH